jgi:hypothetical protein
MGRVWADSAIKESVIVTELITDHRMTSGQSNVNKRPARPPSAANFTYFTQPPLRSIVPQLHEQSASAARLSQPVQIRNVGAPFMGVAQLPSLIYTTPWYPRTIMLLLAPQVGHRSRRTEGHQCLPVNSERAAGAKEMHGLRRRVTNTAR